MDCSSKSIASCKHELNAISFLYLICMQLVIVVAMEGG